MVTKKICIQNKVFVSTCESYAYIEPKKFFKHFYVLKTKHYINFINKFHFINKTYINFQFYKHKKKKTFLFHLQFYFIYSS